MVISRQKEVKQEIIRGDKFTRTYLKKPLNEGVEIRIKEAGSRFHWKPARFDEPSHPLSSLSPITLRFSDPEASLIVGRLVYFWKKGAKMHCYESGGIRLVDNPVRVQRAISHSLKEYMSLSDAEYGKRVESIEKFCMQKKSGRAVSSGSRTESGLPIPEYGIAFSDSHICMSQIALLFVFKQGKKRAFYEVMRLGSEDLKRTKDPDKGYFFNLSGDALLLVRSPQG